VKGEKRNEFFKLHLLHALANSIAKQQQQQTPLVDISLFVCLHDQNTKKIDRKVIKVGWI
jgi:hypothetical protein